ncbi:MAG: adenylate/guanylate cyclase domain-containing protein [Candidatus Competibacter sp.]|nr:adenylate/guanylate cyclase domain-containing protein [Candidatus Competibacter sp.]
MAQKLSDLMSGRGDRPASAQQIEATVLFADMCGSTRLFEQYGDWRAREIESRVLSVLSAKAVEFDGKVVKTIGDEIMCRFPNPESGVSAACDMHAALKADPKLRELNIAVKIGLHNGLLLIEQGDLFGDAVNIAARMVSQAKADQIITTRDTVDLLADDWAQMIRGLGRVWVRGKQEDLEIFEVLWQEETASLTQLFNVDRQEELRLLLRQRLTLDYGSYKIEVKPTGQPFRMGRGTHNDLVIDRELVSRSHADIEFRQGKFVLVDHSTNGTYLMLENGSRFFVRREEFTLQDRGIICLGQAVSKEKPDLIHYACGFL